MCAVFCGSAQATQRAQTYMGEFAGRWRRSASKGKHSSTPGHTDRTDGTDHTNHTDHTDHTDRTDRTDHTNHTAHRQNRQNRPPSTKPPRTKPRTPP